MMTTARNSTALNYACYGCASFNVFNMLIDVGGKDLVLANNNCLYVDTSLHILCHHIHDCDNAANKIKLLCDNVASKIKLLLHVPGRDNKGKTPLDIATIHGASDEIKALLEPHTINSEPQIADSHFSNSVPDDLKNVERIN